jgi:hypothetical protein
VSALWAPQHNVHLQELESYTGGVLHDRTGAKGLDHDVEITGWGETADGQKYPRSTQRVAWFDNISHDAGTGTSVTLGACTGARRAGSGWPKASTILASSRRSARGRRPKLLGDGAPHSSAVTNPLIVTLICASDSDSDPCRRGVAPPRRRAYRSEGPSLGRARAGRGGAGAWFCPGPVCAAPPASPAYAHQPPALGRILRVRSR